MHTLELIQHGANAPHLRGRAAQRELIALGRDEVPVHRIRHVDPEPAVHVDRV